jgi:transglutaminase-like putative cysteine protease
MKASRLWLGPLIVAGCTHWSSPPRALPEAHEHPDADAVILDDEVELRLGMDVAGNAIVDERRYVRELILREPATRLGRLSFAYDPAFEHLTALQARTIGSDGKEHRRSLGDARDVPILNGFAMYSDARALQLDLSPVSPGTVVEYRYTTRHTDWRFTQLQQTFEGRYPIRHVRLAVSRPREWQVAVVAMRDNVTVAAPPSAENSDGARLTTTWELRDVPALAPEPFSPSLGERALTVVVRPVHYRDARGDVDAPTDARQLSAHLYELTRAAASSSRVSELADEITLDVAPDAMARSRRLYEWVRDQISYCAIEIGVGGWQPHAADEVARLRYGDCKDKANLLHDLLAAVGITSDLTVLYAHDGLPARYEAIARRSNHAILRIHLPGKTLLVDPTASPVPFGRLPFSDQEADVLPLARDGAALEQAPSSRAADNGLVRELELTPSGDALTGSFSVVARGADADELRYQLSQVRTDEQWRPIAAASGLSRWRLANTRAEHRAPSDEPLVARGALQRDHAWAQSGLRVLRVADLLDSSVPALPRATRHSPIVFHVRRQSTDRVRLVLGSRVELTLPSPAVIERPFGRFEVQWRAEAGVLTATRTLTLDEHLFPAARYDALKQFFDEILAAEDRIVTIRSLEKGNSP